MALVYLALGTNLGNRAQNLLAAIERLGAQVNITARSRIYETEPWGIADQPRFLNMAIAGNTQLGAPALLHFLKETERELGRAPGLRYGPRVIDLDILFYDDIIIHTPELDIPHPRVAERRFVLIPLADVAPELIHPVLKLSVSELLARLPDDASVKPYSPFVQ